MKAIAKTRPALGVELIDTPVPRPGEGELLVKVAACGICGSDLHIYEWELGAERAVGRLPAVLGHEPAGEVVEVGTRVERLQDRRSCRARSVRPVRTVRPVHRRTLQLLRHADPAQRRVRRILHRAGHQFMAGAEIDGHGERGDARAIRHRTACGGNFRPSRRRQRGGRGTGADRSMRGAFGARARVSPRSSSPGLEVDAERLELARRMGFKTVCASDRDWIDQVRALMPPGGADVVFDASGALDSARHIVRKGGAMVELGWPARDIAGTNCARSSFMASASSPRACARPRPGGAQSRCVASGAVDLKPMVTHRFDLDHGFEAFELLKARQGVKALIMPQALRSRPMAFGAVMRLA